MDAKKLAEWARTAWDTDIGADDRPTWTVHLNQTLAKLMPPGLVAFGTGLGEGHGQYLVDHCWSKPWEGMASYDGLELAAEFEFGGSRAAIEEDFVKLADVRARYRVFLGNLWSSDWAQVDKLAKDAAAFLAGHARVDDKDSIVLALGPKGRRLERKDALQVWEITRAGARKL